MNNNCMLSSLEELILAMPTSPVTPNPPAPERLYKAGDIITIKLTPEAAYELGCGADAPLVVTPTTIMHHKPVPAPKVLYQNIVPGGVYNTQSSLSVAVANKSPTDHVATIKITIDASRPRAESVIMEIVD